MKDEKALALIHSTISDEIFVHIQNCSDAWSTWKTLKDLLDLQPEAKRVDLQIKLLQNNLIEVGDVMEYTWRLKNIRQEITKASFAEIEDSLMATILISNLPESYKYFLKTLQITDKLENITFDNLNEQLANHDKTFGKKKQLGEDVLVASTSKNTIDILLEKVLILPKEINIRGTNINVIHLSIEIEVVVKAEEEVEVIWLRIWKILKKKKINIHNTVCWRTN